MPGGVSAPREGVCCGGVSAVGGCLLWGVSTPGGSALGGICSGGCLLLGGCASMHWGRHPPCKQNHTRLWKHNLAPTSLRVVKMAKNTGKVREFCQSGKVGTLSEKDRKRRLKTWCISFNVGWVSVFSQIFLRLFALLHNFLRGLSVVHNEVPLLNDLCNFLDITWVNIVKSVK